jgi:hypothetical protein
MDDGRASDVVRVAGLRRRRSGPARPLESWRPLRSRGGVNGGWLEGVELSLSTLADQVGVRTAVLSRSTKRCAAMGSPPPASTATILRYRYRCWRRARRGPADYGPTCATTGRSQGRRRRRRCSSTRPIVAASIPNMICGTSPASSSPTPMPPGTAPAAGRCSRRPGR